MEQPEVYRSEERAADWLSPGAALAHFEPPEGAHQAAVGQVRQETRARYGFRVGDLGLLINPDAGSEVLDMIQVATLPNMPPGFSGLINLRGNLVPLYELRILLGIAQRPAGAATRVLVFGQGEQAVGVIIDNNPRALTALRPLPNFPQLPEALEKHVPAGYVQDDKIWLEFDHGTFFEEISGAASRQIDAALV
jgi:twitching motility protein PilI